MKKLVYLLILISGICNAQIVNIPDANFKTRLLSANSSNTIASTQTPDVDGNVTNYNTIDTNGDGEIQSSEALAIQYLDVQRLSDIITGISTPIITNLSGISSFVNVKSLDCSSNQITSLILSGNYNLKKIKCSYNLLTNLNLSNINSLKYLECFGNYQLSILDLSTNPNITNLACYSNNLSSLNVSNLLGLLTLNCNSNHITSLNINNNLNLSVLQCSSNSLNSLNLSNNTLLTDLNCAYNLLTSLNVSNNTSLTNISCGNNQLTSLNISSNVNLDSLNIQGNQITSMDFSNNPIITYLSTRLNPLHSINVSNLLLLDGLVCSNNLLTTLNLTNNSNLRLLIVDINQFTSLPILPQNNGLLERFSCNDNLFTSLDLSGFPNLNWLECKNNNNLTSLNIKNGNSFWDDSTLDPNFPNPFVPLHPNFQNNPNLIYICADDEDVAMVQDRITSYGYTNCQVNSYCSFTPGGTFYTIQGNIKYDTNNNGCDVNDLVQPNIRMNIAEPNASGASFTNNAGNYAFYTQAGTFTLTPDVENPTWFNFSPNTANIVFADNNNNVATQDFCVTPNGFHPDIEVVISPITPARPGFDAVYQITYKNKGNQTQSGLLSFNYNDATLDYVSSSQLPEFQFEGSIDWDYGDLLPFESRSIQVTLNINTPNETPAVNIGDVLTFSVDSYPSEVDETPLDNEFIYNQTVVGSYDPNDISCLEGNSLPPSEIGNYLHYAINFENTGNYPAENIVVKTEVDATKFDINSLQLLATSNPVDARITGNKVEFIFQNIQLPIGGHGHILLKVKSKSTLVTGDSVAKRADIFFDYNAPIDTGFANTTFQTLSNTIFETDTTINVYPNPTTSKITINSDFELKSIQVYDVQGRILETLIGANKILDISNKANGVYFLKITTNKGSKIEKVIKK